MMQKYEKERHLGRLGHLSPRRIPRGALSLWMALGLTLLELSTRSLWAGVANENASARIEDKALEDERLEDERLLEDKELEAAIWLATGPELLAAEKRLVRGVQTNPASSYYHYLLSQLNLRFFTLDAQRLDLLQKATNLAEQAMLLDQSREFGFLALAQILGITGKGEQGVAILQQLKAQKVPYSWRYHFTAAHLYADLGNVDLALESLDKSLSLPGAIRDLLVPYSILLLQTRYEGKELQAKFMGWNERFAHPAFALMQGIGLSEQGHYAKAHQVYQHLLAKHPDSLEALINDATLLYQHLGKNKQAKQLFHQALSKNPSLGDLKAVIYAHLTAIALQDRDLATAEQHALAALTATDQEIGTLAFILQQYNKSQTHKSSAAMVDLLEKVIRLFPGRAELYALQGQVLGTQLQLYERALGKLRKAAILNPTNGTYLTAIGLNHFHLNQPDLALSAFDKALTLDPEDTLALYNKACVLAMTQSKELALASLTKALSLNPLLQAVAREDSDFQSLKSMARFQELTQAQE